MDVKKTIGEYTHVWTRNNHQIWQGDTLMKTMKMIPCHKLDCSENDHHYHYVKRVDKQPVFFDPFSGFVYVSADRHYQTDKMVCKYKKERCWERYNATHIALYHHTK